ncbi:hypothetical protein GGI21_000976 [Coemansia aciculifera]|nr:hypothetical protein GGI21_000976 [Coemansia aciculifera]
MQPLPSLQRTPHNPQHYLHHQRHLSQPHVQHYTPVRTPSSLAPSSSQKTGMQGGDLHASEKVPNTDHSRQMPPRTPLSSQAAHYVVPSPSTPTSAAEQRALQQSLSPLSSRQRFPSPPLSSSMHSLTMVPAHTPPNISSQTTREHPVSRRARLVDILNPISPVSPVGMPAGSVKSASDNRDQQSARSQLGPLPSLGAVLANVQADEDARSGAGLTEAPFDATSSTSTGTAAEKWRPW